jgi:predicted DNA binding protein
MSAKEIAGRLGISKTTVFYVLKKQKDSVLGNAGIREG